MSCAGESNVRWSLECVELQYVELKDLECVELEELELPSDS